MFELYNTAVALQPKRLGLSKLVSCSGAGLLLLLATGCVGTPKNVQPVSNFNANAYLGTWYEVARLNHRFEKGLNQVTAEYAQQADGTIQVINCGTSSKQIKKCVAGKAKWVNTPKQGFLKVSFFGPFYGSYIVFDTNYTDYSFVSGPNYDYLWLLSRTPTVPQSVMDKFIASAAQKGFDTSKLLYPTP